MAQSNSLVKNNAIKQAVLISIMVSALLPSFMSSSVTVALPSMGKEFGMNTAEFLKSIHLTFIIMTALCLFGIYASLVSKRVSKSNKV